VIAADGEHHVNQAAIFGFDHQFLDLARIPILAIDHRLGSERLTAPPRPGVPAAAEEQNQYDSYQDSLHLITSSSLDWKSDCPLTSLAFI
jgi:hypothetical protein